jgi:formylglycine-generating enzyme required for sulfatase activity
LLKGCPNNPPNFVMPLTLQRSRYQAQHFTQTITEGVGIDMVLISGDSFQMGVVEQEEGFYEWEAPQHLVTVPSFCMGRYPVTQAQWAAVAILPQIKRHLDPQPSNFSGDDLPVEQVSWLDAEEFCLRLSEHVQQEYRLPTEAEWEYACRAGTTTPFHFGKTISSDIANYRAQDWKISEDTTYSGKYGEGKLGEFREKTTPVGYFKVANRFGLSDLHGNVWEWCQDHWHSDYKGAPKDGSAWIDSDAKEDKNRVLRGGSWNYNPRNCRSAARLNNNPDYRYYNVGFRVVSRARTL